MSATVASVTGWLMYFGKTADTHNHLQTKIHNFSYMYLCLQNIFAFFHLHSLLQQHQMACNFPNTLLFHASVSLHILFPVLGLTISLSLMKLVLVFIHPDFDEVSPPLWSLLSTQSSSLLARCYHWIYTTLNIYFHCYTFFTVLQWFVYMFFFSNCEPFEGRNDISWILLFLLSIEMEKIVYSQLILLN